MDGPSPAAWGVWFSSALSTLLPSHRHAGPELNLLTSGTVTYRVDRAVSELEARAGQLIVLPAGESHELVHCSGDVALWVIELDGPVPLPWLEDPFVFDVEPEWRRAAMAATRRIWLRPPVPKARQLQGALWDLLVAFRQSSMPTQVEPLHPAVVRAKQVCERSVRQEMDVEGLARQSGLSASRLAHLFAEQVGITPLQYRNFARVQHFVRSYDGDERNLLCSALDAGFGSYAQFHRVFRQVCGQSPAAHFDWLSHGDAVDAQRTLAAISGVGGADP